MKRSKVTIPTSEPGCQHWNCGLAIDAHGRDQDLVWCLSCGKKVSLPPASDYARQDVKESMVRAERVEALYQRAKIDRENTQGKLQSALIAYTEQRCIGRYGGSHLLLRTIR